jgi:hypothetical protein
MAARLPSSSICAAAGVTVVVSGGSSVCSSTSPGRVHEAREPVRRAMMNPAPNTPHFGPFGGAIELRPQGPASTRPAVPLLASQRFGGIDAEAASGRTQ